MTTTATRNEGDHRMSYVETKQDQGTYLYATHGHNMPADKVAVVGAHEVGEGWHDAFVDREDAVLLVEALTNAIEAHDTREAAAVEIARSTALAAFKVGDRVEIHGFGAGWDGPATVETISTRYVHVQPDSRRAGEIGAFDPEHIRHLPAPNYTALAATFKPGDLAIVSDFPGTRTAPSSGYVDPDAAGRTAVVIGPDTDGCVRVTGTAASGERFDQLIHVAHLTRAKAVPA